MKKILRYGKLVLYSVSLLCSQLSFSQAGGVSLEEQMKQFDAPKAYRAISGFAIRTFPAGEMLRKGLDPDAVKEGRVSTKDWRDSTKVAGEIVVDAVNRKKAPDVYKKYVRDLNRIFRSLKRMLTNLRDKYNLKAGMPAGAFSLELKTYLKAVKTKIDASLKKTATMVGKSLDTIDKKTPVPDVWKQELKGKKVKDVFPKIDKFIKDYMAAKTRDKKERTIKQYDTGKFFIESITGKLERAIYIEQQKSIITRNKKRLADAKETLKDVRKQFPRVVSPLMLAKLGIVTDKASMIILAQAEALRGALEVLKKELEPFFKRI